MIIAQPAWLYFGFPPSLRLVEEMLLERDIALSCETVRRWTLSLLKAEIGFPLFLRTKPLIQLTLSGEAIFVELRHSFVRMRTLLARLRQDQDASGLIINVLPTFALRLLIPRLQAFKAQHTAPRRGVRSHRAPDDIAIDITASGTGAPM